MFYIYKGIDGLILKVSSLDKSAWGADYYCKLNSKLFWWSFLIDGLVGLREMKLVYFFNLLMLDCTSQGDAS